MDKKDNYQVQFKKATYRNDGGFWQDVRSEVRILKNGEVILHLDKVQEIQPIIKLNHKRLK